MNAPAWLHPAVAPAAMSARPANRLMVRRLQGYTSVSPRRAARAAHGFTLIEIMITLVVLSIGILALAAMMPAGSRTMSRARVQTSGAALAAQKLEDLKSLTWGATALAAGTYTDTSGDFARSWTITDNTPMANVKKIVVTVSWGLKSGPRSAVLSTYLTQMTN